jgi:hypothetical protein
MLSSRLISAVFFLLIPLVFISGATVVSSDSTSGSFTFTVEGYTVTGDLTDATIGHGGVVQMLMSIDQTISTSYGAVHITGNGVWSGETDFQSFNGAIGNVAGTVQACAVFYCQNADFTGSGSWTGIVTLSNTSGAQGSGTFVGMLNFSGQQISQSGSSGPAPISGNWTATFET